MAYCYSECSELAPNHGYAPCYQCSASVNVVAPNFKSDPHLNDFCKKFAQYAPRACQVPTNRCEALHRSLRSLDEFSLPPLYRRGGYQPKFRCRQRQGWTKQRCSPPPQCPTCAGIPQLPEGYRYNPKPYGDAICGICVPTKKLAKVNDTSCVQESEDCDQGLPFVVYPLSDPDSCERKTPMPKRTGVAKCIHPSSYRSLETITKLEFPNFFKLKSLAHLALYQSPLAVDNRRPRVCLPAPGYQDEYNLDVSKPLVINAKMLSWKQRGKPKTDGSGSVSVCVPGPITVG